MNETSIAKTQDQNINAFSSAEAFATAQRMALMMAESSLVPQQYQGKKNLPNIMIAMEMAARMRASPFAIMQNLHVIHGRPSFGASFLIATVNACGRFSPLRFKFSGERGTPDWGCFAHAKDTETGEVCEGTLVDIAMAVAEGWATKKGSKWKTMPEQMLRYRAASFWQRAYAPEVSLGMHTRDEIADIGTVAVIGEARSSSSLGQKLAAQAELAESEVVADAPQDAEPVREPTPEPDSIPIDHEPDLGEVYGEPGK